jgi:bifunctional non-homologous end joining protein LigD
MGQAALRANHARGAVSGSGDMRSKGDQRLRFIIQKHDARQIHFDFRLELDGTLKSWAVTHGPSLDPAEKRLAVRTDDQPIEKGTTADTIAPADHFDGNVLWDAGCWHPHGDPHEGLESGILKFDLEGDRLKGAFVLMRLGNNAKSKRENWLLIKGPDRYAQRAEAPVKASTGKVESPPDLEG